MHFCIQYYISAFTSLLQIMYSFSLSLGVLSFASFKSMKSKEWHTKTHKKEKKPTEDVIIALGVLQFSEKECKLKPIRGKRLALRCNPDETYEELRKKAVGKGLDYYPECLDKDNDYFLAFEGGNECALMPGTSMPFNLAKYKDEVGRDYKRIVLYLCSVNDKILKEKFEIQYDDISDVDSEPPKKKRSLQEIEDEKFAANLQEIYANEIPQYEGEQIIDTSTPRSSSDILTELSQNVIGLEQFFLVIRRNTDIERILTLWSRNASKISPENKLVVKYSGESGIDSGAVGKEFLTETMKQLRAKMFPGGAPRDSMLDIQNGNFITSGQILSVSLVQGGPSLQCFHKSVYNLLLNDKLDLKELEANIHLVPADKALLDLIKEDPQKQSSTIIDNGYSGVISMANIEVIVETVMISIISRRKAYLCEVAKGLQLFGLYERMVQNKEAMKSLFLVNSDDCDTVDSNYVYSIMEPVFSSESSSRRIIEEKVFDYFQDFLNELEDTKMVGHPNEIIAYKDDNYVDDEDQEATLPYCDGISADLTPSGLLGWMTGQKHRPLFGEDLTITVHFNHDCLNEFPGHRICFPVVCACSREITLKTQHCETYAEFRDNILLAYSKGQAFGLA